MNAIITITIGEEFRKIARITHPPMRDYARKVGAEFFVISVPKHSTPLWDKLQLYDLLDRFNRIICIDSDALVLPSCPNLFEIVPEGILGIYDEGLLTTDEEKKIHTKTMEQAAELHGLAYPANRGNRFYNAGVMVLSQNHKFIFEHPRKEVVMPYTDQPLYNLRIFQDDIEVQDLTYKFNRMPYVDSKVKEDRIESHIIHYAGLGGVAKLAAVDLVRATTDNQIQLIPDRDKMLDILGISDMICAEIGTYQGWYSEEIYKRDPKELWLVDPWIPQSPAIYPNDHANVSLDKFEAMYYGMLHTYNEDPKVHIIRDFSIHAAGLFPDEYFDFVYIDAIHTLESCLADIATWHHKVKRGGWLCGHDYNIPAVKTAVRSFLTMTNYELSFLCTEGWSSWGIQR